MPLEVPGSFDELTTDWLRALLGQPELGSIEIEPLGSSVGLLGDLARIRISDPRPASMPTSLIVKLPTADPAGHEVGRMLRAWAREVAFYTEIAPASPGARVPRCYGTQADENAGRWVVVLEDCEADPVDHSAGATPAQMLAATVALADFHATWWESPSTPHWMPAVSGQNFGGLQAAWTANHPAFTERYAKLLPATSVDVLNRFTPQLASWAAKAATEPTTIVHADYRLDNLLFHDGLVTMIDWQTALRGPGAMDLSCFLATSLPVDARRENEETLIERYLQQLEHRSIVVDRTWFEVSYDENLLWWMGQFGNNLAHLEPDDSAAKEGLENMVVRTFTAAIDRDVERLL